MPYNIKIKPAKCTSYVPKALTAEELASPHVKRAAAGACWLGHLQKLPSKNACVTWELQKIHVPPAHFRPVKPKIWLKHTVELKANMYYKLD